MSVLEINEGQPDSSVETGTTAPSGTNQPDTNKPDQKPEGDQEKTYAGKYKTVEDLEKGYKESTKYTRELNAKVKEFEAKIPKAPESYTFDFKEVKGLEGVEISPEDPDMKAMIPVFKELNLTQEQASRLVAAHIQNMTALAETPEQIKEKLGANSEVIIGKLQSFTNKLPIEDQKVMQALADTAGGIDFLYRHLVGSEQNPPAESPGGSGASKSAAELKSEAFKFKSEHSRSIGFDKGQQEQYAKMMRTALVVEENEAKAKKK